MSTRGPIFDTHIHFYQVTRPGGVPWPPAHANKRLYRDVLPAEYRALAQQHGVVGAGILEASPLREDNRRVLALIEDDSFFRFLVASADIDAPDFVAELDSLAADRRLVGVRAFLWTGTIVLDARQRAHLTALAARGMSLDIVSRRQHNPKDRVAALARSTPRLRVMIDHLGGALGERPAPEWVEAIRLVAAEPNVSMKFSSFFDMYNPTGDEDEPWPTPTDLDAYRGAFDVLMQAFGPDRLIWGSNWPVSAMGGDFGHQIALAEEYLAPFGTEVRNKVMHDNAVRFYQRP